MNGGLIASPIQSSITRYVILLWTTTKPLCYIPGKRWAISSTPLIILRNVYLINTAKGMITIAISIPNVASLGPVFRQVNVIFYDQPLLIGYSNLMDLNIR